MARKTKKDQEDIRQNLDNWMDLAGHIADRNPEIKVLRESLQDGTINQDQYQERRDRLLKQIYGEVFPCFPFPVWQMKEFENKDSEIILRIDLNYTKDEIMFALDKFVSSFTDEYRRKHETKHIRRTPSKWRRYLEIWDLKSGWPPWVAPGGGDFPYYYGMPGKQGRPWTYEEIAKHLYPDQQAPEELEKAISRVKAQYRAAYRLITGEEYKPNETRERMRGVSERGFASGFTCDQCPDQSCKITGEICPRMLEELEKVTIKQQHKFISEVSEPDINQYEKGRKKHPSQDHAFD